MMTQEQRDAVNRAYMVQWRRDQADKPREVDEGNTWWGFRMLSKINIFFTRIKK